jgi:predicted molibdopterin-dependent oxidoreductase YjgC
MMTNDASASGTRRRWVRVASFKGAPVPVTIDGTGYEARAGESVLSAVLAMRGHVRLSELDGTPRAGFCLMGACQDCWIWVDGSRRVRACGTQVAAGMAISTTQPPVPADA